MRVLHHRIDTGINQVGVTRVGIVSAVDHAGVANLINALCKNGDQAWAAIKTDIDFIGVESEALSQHCVLYTKQCR